MPRSDFSAPAYPSEDAILDALDNAMRALRNVRRGYRPFSYSYYFDDGHNHNRTGPMEGVIWAKDQAHALQHVGVTADGSVYGYERVVTPLPWEGT